MLLVYVARKSSKVCVCVCVDIHLSVFYTIAHYLSDPNHIFIVLSFEVGREGVWGGWGQGL